MIIAGHILQRTRGKRCPPIIARPNQSSAVRVWVAITLLTLCGCTRERDPNRPERIQWKAGQPPVEIAPGRHVSIRSASPTTDNEVRLDDYGEKAFWFALGGSGEIGGTELLAVLPAYSRANDAGQRFTVDIRWSADGLKSVLLVNGQAEAVFDFDNEFWMSRMQRPETADLPWSRRSRKWNEAVLTEFEGLKAGPTP